MFSMFTPYGGTAPLNIGGQPEPSGVADRDVARPVFGSKGGC
jgi:hypothetical protein